MADDLDLEEELLQVAGRRTGGSSKKRGRSKRAADSDDEQDSDNLFGSDSDGGSDDDQPKRKKGSAAQKKQSRARQESEEEDAYDDGDDDPDETGYGSDLYIDEEDRRKLESMTELEREMILAERAEERDKQRQRREILKKANVDKVSCTSSLVNGQSQHHACMLESMMCGEHTSLELAMHTAANMNSVIHRFPHRSADAAHCSHFTSTTIC